MAPAPNTALCGVLLCLPTAPALPLWGTETSVRRRFFFGQLSDKQLLACISLCGVSDLKHNGRPRIKRRALLAVRAEFANRTWRQGQTISMASARIETVKVCENGGDAQSAGSAFIRR